MIVLQYKLYELVVRRRGGKGDQEERVSVTRTMNRDTLDAELTPVRSLYQTSYPLNQKLGIIVFDVPFTAHDFAFDHE